MFKTTALLKEGLQWQVLPKSWHCQKGGWGWIWPMPRFSGGFDKVYKGQTKVILTDKSKFAPKNDNFPPKGDQLPSISEQIHRNHFDPPEYMLIYVLFIDCRKSHLRAFCRQIHQCARIGGWEGGVKPILEMPGFWKRLSLQALPKGGTENIQSFVTFWLWTVSLRVHLLIRKPSQHLIAEFVLKKWTILKGPVQQKHPMQCHSCCCIPLDKKTAPQFMNEIRIRQQQLFEV